MSHDDSMTLGLSYQSNFRAIRTTLDLSMTILMQNSMNNPSNPMIRDLALSYEIPKSRFGHKI